MKKDKWNNLKSDKETMKYLENEHMEALEEEYELMEREMTAEDKAEREEWKNG